MMFWFILLVIAIRGGGFGGYSAGGEITISVVTRGSNLGGDGVS